MTRLDKVFLREFHDPSSLLVVAGIARFLNESADLDSSRFNFRPQCTHYCAANAPNASGQIFSYNSLLSCLAIPLVLFGESEKATCYFRVPCWCLIDEKRRLPEPFVVCECSESVLRTRLFRCGYLDQVRIDFLHRASRVVVFCFCASAFRWVWS